MTQGSSPQESSRQEWISGRFRGVYASERSGAGEGARRLPIQLQYGELSDVQPSAGPAPGEAADELRFAKLPRVTIASTEGAADRERTLFDVRIRAWQLLYPAESARRIYGTLVGELSGRLEPLPIEPAPLEARMPEPAPPLDTPAPQPRPLDPILPAASAPAPLPPAPTPPAARPDEGTAEQNVERLLWLIVPVLLCVVGGALALACSPQTAGIWLAPLAAAIAIRQTPSRFRIQGTLARRWLGGVCVLAQGFVLLAPLQTEWTAGCRPPLRAELALLAAPLVASALVRPQAFLWVCALIWTTALAAWCGNLDGTCSAAALAAAPRSAAALSPEVAVPSTPATPARTNPDGRWPATPKARPARSPDSTPEPAPPAPRAEEPSRAREAPPARAPDSPRSGGGVGEALGFPRISLDQASVDPDAFFRPDGPRVYIPSDRIFEPGRPNLRAEAEATLDQIAKLLALHPERRVVVEIHTDASADAVTRRTLGRQRATALADWFVRRGGLAAGQLKFEPMGAARPLVPPDGDYMEQRANRRLELRLAETSGRPASDRAE